MTAPAAFTVSDLATEKALCFACNCGERTFRCDRLIAMLGADTRLHHIGLRRALWCVACGEPPLSGWIVKVDDARG